MLCNHLIYESSNMIDSNERKLSLSDWLKKNHCTSYKSPLKLQTFLLLYEALTKVAAEQTYNKNAESINTQRAEKCAFIVGTMTEKELSDLTHQMNLWKSKENRIMSGEYQVDLDKSDFNSHDEKLIDTLDKMYPTDMIENSAIVNLDKNYFVFSKSDSELLTEKHFNVLLTLAESEELHNPVFVDIDKEGRLLVD